jgi:hypothetical protein
VGTLSDATKYAGNLYRRAFRWIQRPVRRVEGEAHHLHEVEREGESGETPFIAILGLLFFLVPLFLVILGLSLLFGHLFG